MSNTRKAIFFSFVSKYLSLIVQFASITIIARLLTPEEIGIYSISAAFFGLLLLIRDFGIGSYLVQEKELTDERIAASITLSLSICWSLALLIFLGRGFIADFYSLPEMNEIFLLLTINLLIIPFGTITLAILKRNMLFKDLMFIDIFSNIINASSSVVCAYLGMEYLSLAIASVLGTLATVIASVFFRPKGIPWMPGLRELKRVSSFGWKVSAANFFNHISSTSTDLILGKMAGAVPVAIINRSYSTIKLFDQLIINAVNPVLQSYVSELSRKNKGIKEAFLNVSCYNLILAWPFLAFLSVNTESVVSLLFGDQWLETVPLIRIICISFGISAVTKFYESFMVSMGHPSKNMRLAFVLMLVKISLVIYFGNQGLTIICYALIIPPIIRLLIIAKDIGCILEMRLKDYNTVCTLPLLISLLIIVSNLSAQYLLSTNMNGAITLTTNIITASIAWLAIVYLLNHPIKQEVDKVLIKITNKITKKEII